MAKRRKKVTQKKDDTLTKYLILFAAATLFIIFFVIPNLKTILIGLGILLALIILCYWKVPRFRETFNRKVFHKEPKVDDEEETVKFSKPNGKKILEATVMPLNIRDVPTEILTEELVRRKEIKFRGQ